MNPALTLLQQIVARWKATSPNFFKVITTISTICAIITGIPTLLTYLHLNLDILPGVLQSAITQTVFYATAFGALISSLTVATPTTEKVLQDIKKTGSSDVNKEAKLNR